MGQYVCLWEFQARAGREAEFERHYGPDGTWVTLFRQAPGYIETLLLRDRSHSLRYLTVDRWVSVDAYRAFHDEFARQYNELDRLCEGLTTHEASLGEFTD